MITFVAERYSQAPLFAIGWSLGANILVNYLGEQGAAAEGAAAAVLPAGGTHLSGAASMCNPIELTACDAALEHGMGRVYSRSMGSGLRRVYEPHAPLFVGHPTLDAAGASSCVTVRDFDEAITRRAFGFPSVDAYYQASGSASKVPTVKVPLLCVAAADDPIAVDDAVPRAAIAANPHAALVVTPSGGHLGWITTCSGAFGPPQPYTGVLQWFTTLVREVAAAKKLSPPTATGAGRVLAAAGRE